MPSGLRAPILPLRWTLPLAALGGGLAALGQPPWGLVLPALAGLALGLAAMARAASPRDAFLTGWTLGTAHFALALHWIVEPFQIDAARYGWMAPFALVFLSLGLGLFWGAAGWLAARTGATGGPGRRALLAALALAGAEMLRAVVLTGFPWALVGHVWALAPQAQLAAFVGTHGLTLLALVPLGLLLAGLDRAPLLAAGVFALVQAAALGLALQVPPAPAAGADAPIVRLVQPNATQSQKWDPDHVARFLDRQLLYTGLPGTPALTIWPETAVAWLLQDAPGILAQISQAAGDRPVLLGINATAQGAYTNSMVLLGPGGQVTQRYDKARLVPFGEYIPIADLASRLGLRGFAARDGAGYAPGPGARLLDLGPLGAGLPLICYEAIFPGFGLELSQRAGLMVQITNDAWFGTGAGPVQHLTLARMRAIERGLPLLRVANTGISAAIDARGQVLRALPLDTAGAIDVALPPRLPPTLYSRTGDLPAVALLLLLSGGALLLARRRRDRA